VVILRLVLRWQVKLLPRVLTKWNATDSAWTTATFTAYHAVIYDSTAGNDLICSIDFGGAKTVSAGTFTIQWDSDGIITLA